MDDDKRGDMIDIRAVGDDDDAKTGINHICMVSVGVAGEGSHGRLH